MKQLIELIVPCYNEEKCVELFYDRICEVFSSGRLSKYNFAITYVDDGSKDNTMLEIKKVVEKHENAGNPDCLVQYISLSRNFGKEAALFAGLSKSIGDFVCVLDADLQHPPELMEDMLAAIEDEDYDCASARRVSRKGEPFIRSMFSRAYYHVINKLTEMELLSGATDYRLMKRKVVEAILSMPERERFTKGIYYWIGFRNKWIEYENVERVAGNTTWNFGGLIKYGLNGVIAFATKPLRSAVYFGLFIVFAALVFGIYTAWAAYNLPGSERTGYATIVILILFFSGIIILILGIIGEYIARIYMEVKNRPIYFARETNIPATPSIDEEKTNLKL